MEDFYVNTDGIKISSSLDSEMIFQRHADYDRNEGILNPESIQKQKELVETFTNDINFNNTYFLFLSSPTSGANDLKRCVETTDIALDIISKKYNERNINNHIMNLNDNLNYDGIKEIDKLKEPDILHDNSGFKEFLIEKYGSINLDFWDAFESDIYKEKREEMNAEGPEDITKRALYVVELLKKYSAYFKMKKPNDKLIIWCGTHYDLISPFVKECILDLDKDEFVGVDYLGGITINLDNLTINLNGINYPLKIQDRKQHHLHFQK